MNPGAIFVLFRYWRFMLKAVLLTLAMVYLGAAGIFLALLFSLLAYNKRYRAWFARQPGYQYYVSRLPGLHTVEPPVKFSLVTLLYMFACSAIPACFFLSSTNLTDPNYLLPAILGSVLVATPSIFLLVTWFTGKWGFRDRTFDIGLDGVGRASIWRKFLAGMELDISSHVAREFRRHSSTFLSIARLPWSKRALDFSMRIWYAVPYLWIFTGMLAVPVAIFLAGTILLPLILFLSCFPDFRRWLIAQPGYVYRLARFPGLRRYHNGEVISFLRLVLVATVYLGPGACLSYGVASSIRVADDPLSFLPWLFLGLWGTIFLYGFLIQNWHFRRSPAKQIGDITEGIIGDIPLVKDLFSSLEQTLGNSQKKQIFEVMWILAHLSYDPASPEQGIDLAIQTCRFAYSKFGRKSAYFVASLERLSDFYTEAGLTENAAWLNLRLKDVVRAVYGSNHLYYVDELNRLGVFYVRTGAYREAMQSYQEAWEVERRTLGWKHPRLIETLSALSDLYREFGNVRLAEALLWIALDVQRRKSWRFETKFKQLLWPYQRREYRRHQREYALLIDKLALFYQEQGAYDKARPLFLQAYELRRGFRDEHQAEFATSLSHLAWLAMQERNVAEAKELYSQVVQAHEQLSGTRHQAYATALKNLGCFYLDIGNYEQAGPLLEQALALTKQIFGEEHPEIVSYLTKLACFYGIKEQAEQALLAARHAIAIDERTLVQAFMLGSENQRLHYVETLQGHVDLYLSLVLQFAAHSSTEKIKAMEVILRRKAIGVEALMAQHDLLQSGRYPEQEKKLRRLHMLNQRIRQRTLALDTPLPGTPEYVTYQRELDEWSNLKEALDTELIREISEQGLLPTTEQITCASVAAALPAESALVEFVRFGLMDVTTRPPRTRTHYLAFVLLAGQGLQIEMVDLGEAQLIEQALTEMRSTITDDKVTTSPDAWQKGGRAVRGLVIDPLVPKLQGRTRLYLAPDGELNLLSFQVLPLNDPLPGNELRYMIDTYHLSYLNAGRDVLDFLRRQDSQAGPPLVIADPDFSFYEPGERTTHTSATLEEETLSRDLERAGYHFQRLPGTRDEGQLVAQQLGVQPLMGAEALKGRVKSYRSPRILHIATHGFFLPAQQTDQDSIQAMAELFKESRLQLLAYQHIANPLLRSGLALAGAESWNQGKRPPDQAENGILTAEEIASLTLQGTELVVLSACDTGKGQIHTGEGVFGLRRAFVIAGARRLVMSLWKVSDRKTQQLMDDFYTMLKIHETCSEALRAAQLQAKMRDPHPATWGAFICQDNPQPLSL